MVLAEFVKVGKISVALVADDLHDIELVVIVIEVAAVVDETD